MVSYPFDKFEIHKSGKTEINSLLIGNLVLEKLKKLDPVAHVRFASVFKDFKNIETFKQELKIIEQS